MVVHNRKKNNIYFIFQYFYSIIIIKMADIKYKSILSKSNHLYNRLIKIIHVCSNSQQDDFGQLSALINNFQAMISDASQKCKWKITTISKITQEFCFGKIIQLSEFLIQALLKFENEQQQNQLGKIIQGIRSISEAIVSPLLDLGQLQPSQKPIKQVQQISNQQNEKQPSEKFIQQSINWVNQIQYPNQVGESLLTLKKNSSHKEPQQNYQIMQKTQRVLERSFQEQTQEIKPCKTNSTNCKFHNNNIRYYCKYKHHHKDKYLCNLCLQQQQYKQRHQKHKIICKQHNSLIRYKIKISQITRQDVENDLRNLYLCQECLINQRLKSKSDLKYFFVLKCHYQYVEQICLNQQCVKANNFKICRRKGCPNQQRHSSHQKIKLNKQSFLQYFSLSPQQIGIYEQQYFQANKIVKLQQFPKVYQKFLAQINSILINLQSFSANSQQWAEIWTQQFFKQEKKECILILLGAKKLETSQCKQQYKKQFLKIFNRVLQAKLTPKMHQISRILQSYVNDIKKSWAQASDIQNRDWNEPIDPYKLKQKINLEEKQKSKIIIIKDDTNMNQNHNEKKMLQNFMKNIKQNSILDKKTKQQKEKIQKEICSINYPTQLNSVDSLHKTQIIKLLEQKQQLSSKLQFNSYKLQTFQLLTHFHNLRIIDIEYGKHDGQTVYQMDASKVFHIIYQNQGIEKIKLTGIRITELGLFMKHLKLIQTYLIGSTNNLRKYRYQNGQIDVLSFYEDGYLEQVNLTKRRPDLQWMKRFNYYHKLNIFIEAELHFNFHSITQVKSNIVNLSYFLRWNIIFSNIDFRINMQRNDSIKEIKTLLNLMKKMNEIKVALMKYRITQFIMDDPFHCIMSGLSEMKNIKSFSLKNIYCQDSVIQNKLRSCFKTLSKNNQIRELKLQFCNLPFLPSFYHHHLIKCEIKFCEFKKVQKYFLRKNKNLKQLKINSNKFGEGHLDVCLKPKKNIQNLVFCNIDERVNSQLTNLSLMNMRKLKFLKLQLALDNTIQQQSFKKILQKLFSIIEITLIFQQKEHQTNNERANYLLLIPSQQLKYVHIEGWSKISNKDVIKILKKWNLKELRLRSCSKINKDILQKQLLCQLQLLKLDRQIFQKCPMIEALKKEGVKVFFYQQQKDMFLDDDQYQ